MKKIIAGIGALLAIGTGYLLVRGGKQENPPSPPFFKGGEFIPKSETYPPLKKGGEGGFFPSAPVAKTIDAAPQDPPDEVLIPADRMDEDDSDEYPADLMRRTRRYLEMEQGRVPDEKEVSVFLDKINEQIHEANREMSENVDLFKKYHEEGNLKAMEALQKEIFDKHVAVYPDLAPPRQETYTDEEKEFSKRQFLEYLRALQGLHTEGHN